MSFCDINISEKLIFKDHKSSVNSVLYFSSINVIVSSSKDPTIVIYYLNRNQQTCLSDGFERGISDSVKHSLNSFFVCSGDVVKGYKFGDEMNINKIFEIKMENTVFKLLKLNEIRILAVVGLQDLAIVDTTNKEVIKKCSNYSHRKNLTALCVSTINSSNFFISSSRPLFEIDLVNFENLEIERTLNKHEKKCFVLCCFVNSSNEEILIAGLEVLFFYLYNTSSSNSFVKVLIGTQSTPECFLLVNNLLYVGESFGNLEIFSMSQNDCERVYKEKFHSSSIHDLKLMKLKKERIKICSCSGGMNVVKVSVLPCINMDISNRMEFRDHKNVVSSVVYFSLYNLLVTSSYDSSIIVYDLNKKQSIHQISDFKGDIYRTIKFSSNSFISCSRDHYIRGYEFSENGSECKLFFEMKMSNVVFKVIKLCENKIGAIVGDSMLCIVDSKEKKIVHSLRDNYELKNLTGLTISKKNPCNFYIATRLYGFGINIINFENFKIRVLQGHNNYVYCLTCFVSSEKTEYLIAACADFHIYVYKTDLGNEISMFKIGIANHPISLLLVENKFLFVGEAGGMIEIFSIQIDKKIYNNHLLEKVRIKKEYHPKQIMDLELIEGYGNAKKNRGIFCSCDRGANVKISEYCVTGSLMSFDDALEEEEEKEEVEEKSFQKLIKKKNIDEAIEFGESLLNKISEEEETEGEFDEEFGKKEEVVLTMSDLYMIEGKNEKSIHFLEKYIEKQPSIISFQKKKAEVEFLSGKLSSSEESFSNILQNEDVPKSNDDLIEIHEYLGEIQMSRNKKEEALLSIEKAIELDNGENNKHRSNLLYKASIIQDKLKKTKEAIELMNKSIEKEKKISKSKLNKYFFRSVLRSKENDINGSIEDLNILINNREFFKIDDQIFLLKKRGMLFQNQKKYDEAIEALEEAKEMTRKLEKVQIEENKRFSLILNEGEFECLKKFEIIDFQQRIDHLDFLIQLRDQKEDEKEKEEKRHPKEIKLGFITALGDYDEKKEEGKKLEGSNNNFNNMMKLLKQLKFDKVYGLLEEEMNKKNFELKFNELLLERIRLKKENPGSEILTVVYFSGHGYFRNHTIFHLKNKETIDIQKYKLLLRSENCVNIFFLDCCQNFRKPDSIIRQEYLNRKKQELSGKKFIEGTNFVTELKDSNSIIFMAQEPGLSGYQIKDTDGNWSGAFTDAIVKHFQRENQNIEYLMKLVNQTVRKNTEYLNNYTGESEFSCMIPCYFCDLMNDYIWNRTSDFTDELSYLREKILKMENILGNSCGENWIETRREPQIGYVDVVPTGVSNNLFIIDNTDDVVVPEQSNNLDSLVRVLEDMKLHNIITEEKHRKLERAYWEVREDRESSILFFIHKERIKREIEERNLEERNYSRILEEVSFRIKEIRDVGKREKWELEKIILRNKMKIVEIQHESLRKKQLIYEIDSREKAISETKKIIMLMKIRESKMNKFKEYDFRRFWMNRNMKIMEYKRVLVEQERIKLWFLVPVMKEIEEINILRQNKIWNELLRRKKEDRNRRSLEISRMKMVCDTHAKNFYEFHEIDFYEYREKRRKNKLEDINRKILEKFSNKGGIAKLQKVIKGRNQNSEIDKPNSKKRPIRTYIRKSKKKKKKKYIINKLKKKKKSNSVYSFGQCSRFDEEKLPVNPVFFKFTFSKDETN